MKNVLITGATGDIGYHITKKYIENGYFCLVVTTDKKKLKVFSKKQKKNIKFFVSNFLIEKKFDNFLKKIQKEKKIDVVINCAGINIIKPINDVNNEDLNKIYKINYLSAYKILRIVLRTMKKNNFGRIVNISSIWSVISKPYRSLYSGTKSGIVGLTRSLALEFAKNNITINCLSPGFVMTKLTRQSLNIKDLKFLKNKIPLKRFAKPSEIAEVVYFLGNEKNKYITGQNIVCDGGFSII